MHQIIQPPKVSLCLDFLEEMNPPMDRFLYSERNPLSIDYIYHLLDKDFDASMDYQNYPEKEVFKKNHTYT